MSVTHTNASSPSPAVSTSLPVSCVGVAEQTAAASVTDDSKQGPVSTNRVMETVLVTGANGLVGQALCAELVARGFAVYAAVRDPASFVTMPGVQLVRAPDLADPQAHWPLEKVDVVIHTAARVHVMNPAPDELDRFRAINRDGAAHLARACVEAGVKRLIFLSTIKVNGERTDSGRMFSATDEVAMPTDPYALSKFEAEQILLSIGRDTDLEVAIIRPPLVYGPGAKGNLALLERVVRLSAKTGLPLPLGALNFNRRSLVSLANLVDLVVVCVKHPGAVSRVFLVSDGHDLSTLDLAKQIARACDLSLKTVALPAALLGLTAKVTGKHEMLRRLTDNLQVDIGPTREQLDWTPPQTVEQGMVGAFMATGTSSLN